MPPTTMRRGDLSSFVGRKVQIQQLKELVRTRRLVTLVGVGGVGKTRLAARVASEVQTFFTGGFWFVDLAAVDQASLVPHAVAVAVGARAETSAPVVPTLAERFRAGRCLLLVDNCEHLVDAAAELCSALVESCPSLTILATSREPLCCEGEHVYHLMPLALPTPGDPPSLADVAHSEAGQLFLERASAAANYQPDQHSGVDLATVLNGLDGIPLAVELGAGLLRALTLSQLASRSSSAFQIVRAGSRLAPTRQQTLEATIDWSYRLLSQPERLVFERLGVFAGGISNEAAESVCADDEIARDMVLPTLVTLVDKSLVEPDRSSEHEPRFRLLETVRQFAAARLHDSRAPNVLERHATFFLELAERTFELARASQPQLWYDRLLPDLNNLRIALRYFEAHDPGRLLQLAASLWQFWFRAGLFHEGMAWLERALSSGAMATAVARAKAICGLVELRWPAGHFERIDELSNESLRLAREAGRTVLFALTPLERWPSCWKPEASTTWSRSSIGQLHLR